MWQLPPMSPDNILKYLRKSRTDDPMLTVEEVLAKHEQMLDDWVSQNFPGQRGVPEENCFREVVSGETIESRPKVQELLRLIESPRYKAVLIVEPQRLSRGDLEDIGRLVKLLRYTRTIVITLRYTYDLNDERDRDDFERELKRGNEFLEYQKRIMGNGRLLSVQNGNFIGQRPPYGYRKAVIKEGKRKCHTLEPDPETAPIVQMVFKMYADGISAGEIARRLNSMGVKSALGKSWTVASIKPMITNDHYIGMVHWNRRKTVIVVEDGEIVTTRPRGKDYIAVPGKHPAIIDQELWDAAQAIRATHLPVKPKAKFANPFAGILYCQCGARMNRQQFIRNGVQKSADRLVCVKQTDCATASCSVDEMTAAVISALENAVADFDLKIIQTQEDDTALQEQTVKRLKKRLSDLDRQELTMWDKYTQEAMPKHIFEQLHAKLLADRENAEQELQAAQTAVPLREEFEKKRETFAATIATLQDPDASVKEQNKLLKECIQSITYNRKQKDLSNRRFGTPEPIELSFTFKI